MRESVKQKESTRRQRLSFHPLSFEEAVTDVLKIKPEAKPPKNKAKMKNLPKR